jgi:mevalonate kinase
VDSFEIEVPGKWILSGEHSVLRGQPAIALPHSQYRFTLKYEPNSNDLKIYPNSIANEVTPLFSLLQERWGRKPAMKHMKGSLHFESTIPLRAGFGSSAAFCYAVTAWFAEAYGTEDKDLVEEASRLEDHFHGKSSGLDVAVVASRTPIFYYRGEPPQKLKLSVIPRFTFHDSGVRASTQKCISQVESFISRDPSLGVLYDKKMGSCSNAIREALVDYSSDRSEQAVLQIAEAMNQAQECFYAWDLVPEEVRTIEKQLREAGALGIKVTGAGGGGFLVALWGN